MHHSRVIFLDIDGVLNYPMLRRKANDWRVMDLDLVSILRRVVDQTNSVLVISSTWRISTTWEADVREVFDRTGWQDPPILDRTPILDTGRGGEIRQWLENHEVGDFVIIDDDVFDLLPEQRSHTIRCDSERGLSEGNVQEIENRWL